MAGPELPPLAVYVHLPWCVRKCPYCDFNSHELAGTLPEDAYVEALRRDLAADLAEVSSRRISSVFFGGGTPSLFGAGGIAAILAAIEAGPGLASDCEITLEANPGASDQARFKGFRAAGVNRLSIGAQSFRDEQLQALGRIHDSRAIRSAVEAVRAAGFDNFNLDLMYALPGDTPAGAAADLEAALALEPAHLSWYQLTLEPGTRFHRQPPVLPDEDSVCAIESAGHAMLVAAGFRRYEVSAWEKAGQPCRHNLNYWSFGDYLGIGAGAHGKLTRADGSVLRTSKPRSPQRYLHQAGTAAAREHVEVDDAWTRTEEFLLGALRLVDGFATAEFTARTGLTLTWLEAVLAPALDAGLLLQETGRIRPAERGLRFLDSLLAGLAPPPPERPR